MSESISAADMEVLQQIERLTSGLSEDLQNVLGRSVAGAYLRRAKDEGTGALSRTLIDLLEIDGIVIFWMHKNVGRSDACSLRDAPRIVEGVVQMMHETVADVMARIGHQKDHQ